MLDLNNSVFSLSHYFSNLFSIQQSHLFDNVGTVFFAIFMAIWGE